jgi:hypothetical protein
MGKLGRGGLRKCGLVQSSATHEGQPGETYSPLIAGAIRRSAQSAIGLGQPIQRQQYTVFFILPAGSLIHWFLQVFFGFYLFLFFFSAFMIFSVLCFLHFRNLRKCSNLKKF